MQKKVELSSEWSRDDIGLLQRAVPSSHWSKLQPLPRWSSCQVTAWVSSVMGLLASCGVVASVQLLCNYQPLFEGSFSRKHVQERHTRAGTPFHSLSERNGACWSPSNDWGALLAF